MIDKLSREITNIEKKYQVDTIELQDGTKIWNLIRILLCYYPQRKDMIANESKANIKKIFFIFKENCRSLGTKNKKIDICGFSDVQSRKPFNNTFYDACMDPLYDVLDNFYVFEWPTATGLRNERNKIYSKNYVQMPIPITLLIHKILRKRQVIKSGDLLNQIIEAFSKDLDLNEDELVKHIYDSINIFIFLKKYFVKLLREIKPKAVIISCGYGRFHMALAQACKKLAIPTIEIQHGLITKYHVGYVKASKSTNRDCVPDYILTWGDKFSEIIEKGALFEKDNIVSMGFPFLEKIKNTPPAVQNELKIFADSFSTVVLITGQMIVADELEPFVLDLANHIDKNVGIVFKPHPRDDRQYNSLKPCNNVFLVNKKENLYEILKVVDIHSTVYSTGSIDALSFGIPNIFIYFENKRIDMSKLIDIVDNKTAFTINNPKQFIERINYIKNNYSTISEEVKEISKKFFEPYSTKKLKSFFNEMDVLQAYEEDYQTISR